MTGRDDLGRWEECEDDGGYRDFQFSSPGRIDRSVGSLLRLARAVDYHAGDGATYAFAGMWHHGYSGISPRTGDRVACDEHGEALTEYDPDDGEPTTGCGSVQPTTWVTMPTDPPRRVKPAPSSSAATTRTPTP